MWVFLSINFSPQFFPLGCFILSHKKRVSTIALKKKKKIKNVFSCLKVSAIWGALGLLSLLMQFLEDRGLLQVCAVPFSSPLTANSWGGAWTLRMPVITELFGLCCSLWLSEAADESVTGICKLKSFWKHFLDSWIQPTYLKSGLKKVHRGQHFAAERSHWSSTELVSALGVEFMQGLRMQSGVRLGWPQQDWEASAPPALGRGIENHLSYGFKHERVICSFLLWEFLS